MFFWNSLAFSMIQHQMVNTEIRLIIFFAAKDGEALYSQQKKKKNNGVERLNNMLNWKRQ